MLALVFLMGGLVAYVNAYFTASANKSGDLTFSNVELEITSTNEGGKLFSSDVVPLPGSTLTFDNISVENAGEAEVFAIINCNIYTIRAGYTDYNVDLWYNLQGEQIDVKNMATNAVEATSIAVEGSASLDLEYTFDDSIYDNSFKGATTTVTLKAVAIQAENLEAIGDIEEDALIATYILVEENYVPKASNVADLAQLETYPAITCQTPTETFSDSGVRYNLYNFSLSNANPGDTVYVQAKDADQIYIATGMHTLQPFIDEDYPDGVVNSYGQAITSFTISDAAIASLSSVQTLSTSGFDGNFTVVNKSTSGALPTIRIYTTPQNDLPMVEDGIGIYEIEYANIKSDSIISDTPTQSMIYQEGLWDVSNFRIKNVTENSVVYVYLKNAATCWIGPNNYSTDDAQTIIDTNSPPEGSVVRGVLGSTGQPCINTFVLSAGQDFMFFYIAGISEVAPEVAIYCEPQGDLPYAQDGVAYKLLEDGSGYSAFAAHELLQSATILSTINELPVKNIADSGFNRLPYLTSISLGDYVETIGSNAFGRLDIITIELGDNVKTIGTGAFSESGIQHINISNSVTTICTGAFEGCGQLSSVTFDTNSKLTTIGNGVFYNCTSLTEINIPSSVTTIEDSAFRNCISLTDLVLQAKTGYKWQVYVNSAWVDCSTLTDDVISSHARSGYEFKQVEE